MKIYLSGPMTNEPDFNVPEFTRVAALLREQGHEVTNPPEVAPYTDGWTWANYLRKDLIAMLACDALVRLPKWETSKGAALESYVAAALDFPIYSLIDDKLIEANSAAFVKRNAVIIDQYRSGSQTMEQIGAEFRLTKMRVSQIVNGS